MHLKKLHNNYIPSVSPSLRMVAPKTKNLLWAFLFVVFSVAFASLALALPHGASYVFSTAILIVFIILKQYNAHSFLMLIYLSLLGGIRRWMIPWIGWSSYDTLLLIGPIIIAFDFLSRVLAEHKPQKLPLLSRLLMLILIIMAMEVLNPAQGGIQVGLSGMLFYCVPVMWSFVGMRYNQSQTRYLLFSIVPCIAIAAALYGIYQTFYGLTSSERMWVEITGYSSLHVGQTIRAISFFTSSAEYAQFLSLGIIVLWVMILSGRLYMLVPSGLLWLALFLESARGPVIFTLAGCGIVFAVMGPKPATWLPRCILALTIGVMLLLIGVSKIPETEDRATHDLLQHQADGLANPTDEKKSTATMHANMVAGGFSNALNFPMGKGLGATTIAGAKFGDRGGSTEIDITDMFLATGLIGGLIYVTIVCTVLWFALRLWHSRREIEYLALLGILIVSFGQWLSSGRYATDMLCWLCIGFISANGGCVE